MAGAAGPSWMANYQQQSAASEEQTGLSGIAVPPVKFAEGINHFRVMPPAEAVGAILDGLRNNKAYDLSGGGFPPVSRYQLYLPSYGEDSISLFGNEVVASPLTHLFGDNKPYSEDPVQSWLDKSGIKWMKKAELERDKRAATIRNALACKDRVIMQLVNFGVVAPGLQRPAYNPAELKVESWMIWNDDFEGIYLHPMFIDPEQRGRPSIDPGWWGINMSVTRVGQKRDTKYHNVHGLYGPPYTTHDSRYGYPMLLDQQGNVDVMNIERLLKQVVPFRNLIRVASPEELQEAMNRTMKEIDAKFSPVSVPSSGIPGQPPAQGYGQPPAPPQQQYGAPPASPAQGYGQPPAPPQPYGAPVQPPAPPQGGQPAYPQGGPPAYPQQQQQTAPPPPNYGAPQQPPTHPGYTPQQQQQPYQQPQNMAPVPQTPPQTPNLSSPPPANSLDPRQMQQATQNFAPPAQQQQPQYGAPPPAPQAHGAPQYGAPPAPPQQQQYGAPPAPPPPPGGGAR